MKKNISFFFIMVIINGCFNKDIKSYKEIFYPSGKLKNYGYYIQDSIPVDTLFTLYENGEIMSKEVYDSLGNLIKSLQYFKNGVINEEISYENGLANGFAYVFAESGQLRQKVLYINGNSVGDAFFYDINLNRIERYGFYEWRGNNINLITYDSFTTKPLKDMRQAIYLDSVKIDSTNRDAKTSYTVMLVISNPPKCRSTITIDYVSKKGEVLKSDTISRESYYSVKQPLYNDLFAIKFSGSQYDSISQENYEQWNTRKIREK